MTERKPRVGRRMRELQAIVSAMPGASKSAAQRAAGLPVYGLGTGRELNRAIAAGLIIADRECPWVRRPAHALFTSESDRKLFYLRSELLHGQPSPQRAEEIAAEVDKIRRTQFSEFAEANRDDT